uniref:Ig-like domain-containing protein n=1 Tax=Glossina brevipalpis TaxID=37001 RepID=A0A1A9W2E7_9MUSC
MGNGCSKCCKCNDYKNYNGTLSSASSVYRKRSRGDVPIKNSDRFRITQTSNAVQLAIEHVTTEDAGHYTLFARTKGNDVIRKDVELVLEDKSTGDDPPIFLRRLVDLSVKVGTRTRLLVEIRSSTDMKLTWYRKYRRICENDRIKEINEGSFHYLEVSPVILEDGGQWMVHAENLNGRNSCICHLNVLVPKAYKSPEFIEELKAVLTQQGTVALECKVVGVPTPQLRWFKDSKEIKAGDIFALTANADDPTSLGTYTCEAINCMGKTYSSSKVHVVGRGSREGSLKPADSLSPAGPPPIFTSELRDASVNIGDSLILGCQVVVPPWPKNVVWYNKDGRVDTDERYKLVEDGLGVYMIEIKSSASCDEGEWKCVVTNDDGSVGISTCMVKMEIPKNYRKPRFMESLRAVLTDEGLVSFECKVVGFPAPILKWFKDNQELKPGDVYQLTGTNSLGTYCCVAKNCMGETSSVAVLTIEDIQNQLSDEERLVFTSKNQPPKFLLGLKSQEAKINEAFQFTIKIDAIPDPLLTWFRDELPIQSNERYNHYRGDNQYWHLDVRCLEIVDQAEWKCVAVNDFGTSITSCFLKLQIPRHYKKPKFLECLRAVLTEEGAVNLECKVIGVPQPILKWYKDGVELKPGDIHKIISGQDGTCCLGTYTCEARNCMGVMASSASLLGFEDDYSKQYTGQQHELQRNFSLSTIQEERTSQLYETPAGDITVTERGDVSFSLEGKEVSVSLYETPDLTEEEALKIVEMYADQLSEHITEQNIVELPPLRFVKETSQSGKLLMEATVIDISPEYFTHEEDLRTEAGMSDISINELTVHGFSVQEGDNLDRETEDYAKKSFQKMEEELSLTAPERKRKKSKATETEEFFSLSKATMSPSQSHADEEADDSSELQTFASARMESAKEDIVEQPLKKKSRKSDSDSSRTNETETKLIDISGAVGDGLMVLPDKLAKKVITDEQEIADNVRRLLPLAKMLKVLDAHLCAVEAEVISQSVMMMTASSADQSIAVIKNIAEPLQQIQSKLKVYSGETPIESLFETMKDDIRNLHVGLQVVEKCVEIDERGTTLIQRTSVCIIDSLADQMAKSLEELKAIANSFEGESLKSHLLLTTEDIRQGLEITKGTIKSQALLQEAQELEANKHFTEAVAKLQELPELLPFEKVPQADLPPQAESVKLICQPVWEIQQALEKVENELSLEETDEGIYCKVHQKIVDNLLEPFQHLQRVLQVIEQRAETFVGTEQKINLAILDIVTPPLFELKKGLEVINAQSSNDIEGGKLTVNTVESMVPPLQEIQNGLAQLSQDILSGGQATEDVVLDSDEVKKLLQSLAQAVLHLESNIEQISCKLPQHVPVQLLMLKEHISTLIGQIVDQGVRNIKKPVDELNYCIRQIEQKSITGSLGDLIDPLQSLLAKVKESEDILCISAATPQNNLLIVLHEIQKLIKTIETDIDEYEYKQQLKEIQSEREIATDQLLSTSLQETMEWCIEKEKHREQWERLSDTIKEINNLEFIDSKLRTTFMDLIPPCEKITCELRNVSDCPIFTQNILRSTTDCVQKLNTSLRKLSETTNKSQCNNLLNSVVSNYFEELKLAIDRTEVQPVNLQSSNLAGVFSNILNIIENIVQQCGEDSVDDLSTLEEVSALKSIAESLPAETSFSVKTATLEERRVQAEQLLGQLKQNIATVLAHCNDLDLGCMQTETVQKVKAAVEQIHGFKECLQNTLSMNVMEYLPTDSDPRTMAEAVYSLESCALHIHEYLEQGIVADMSDLEVSELRTIAEPLQELVHAVKVFYTQEFEQVSSMATLTQMSMISANMVQSLKPFILSVHENHAIETLESMANQISLKHLKQFVQPLHELEKALIVQEDNICLLQVEALPEEQQQSLEDLKTLAKPLLCLKDSILHIKEEHALSTLEECPEFKVIAQKSPVLFDLLKYCENMNLDLLEQFEELSSQNLSILKTYAEPQTVAEVRSTEDELIVKEKPQIEIFDMHKCVAESVQLLNQAILKTSAMQTAEVYELNLITQQLRADLLTLNKQKETQSVEFMQSQQRLAKTMFKLKECLVHTYEADVEVAVEDIEKIFEDLLQVIPSLEKQLALEMKEKIELNCSEFIIAIQQNEYQSFSPLVEPIRNLLDSLSSLSDQNEMDIEKSAPLVKKIQTGLMKIVQIIKDDESVRELDQDLKFASLNLGNSVNSVRDFIEKNDGKIRVIELLQEVDYLSRDLKEVSCSLENNSRRNYLMQKTSAVKSFLMALEQGLTENNALVHSFLDKHYEKVQQLEVALKTIEYEILPRVERSQIVWLPEELASIEIIGNLLDNLKENMKILTQEFEEYPEAITTSTKETVEEVSEIRQQLQEEESVEFVQISHVEESVDIIRKALGDDKNLQTLDADLQELLNSDDDVYKTENIFRIREHIVHTYDSSVHKHLENLIDSLLEENLNLLQLVNAKYCLTIKENIESLKADINTLDNEPCRSKLCFLYEKLSSLIEISDRLKPYKEIENSSQKIIELQKCLMEIFFIFDDMLEISDDNLTSAIETVKSLALHQYENNENSKADIKTTKVFEDILQLCAKIKETLDTINLKSAASILTKKIEDMDVEDLGSKAELSAMKAGKFEDKQSEAVLKKVDTKESEAKELRAEISEITAQKVEESFLDSSAKTIEQRTIEDMELKAEISVTGAERIKEEQASADAKKVELMQVEAMKSKAEISEVKAEKIEEKQSEAITRKVGKKETEAKELRAEVTEITAEKAEEKLIDTSAKTMEHKTIEDLKLKAEMSVTGAEKIKEEQASADLKKVELTQVEATKSKAEISETMEHKTIEDLKLKAEMSVTGAEKIKEEQASADLKKVELTQVEATKSKAEISEVKAEKIEEKQSEAITRKVGKKETEAKELKAEISEITLEKVEEKSIDSSAKTIEQKTIEDMKLKAEMSVTGAEKIKEEQASADVKKVELTQVEATKSKAEISEVKAEKIEEKQSEAITRKVDKKETEAKELKAEISEITLEKVEEKLIDSSAKTIEQKKIEEMKLKAEVSEVELQKIKEEQASADAKKVELTQVEATKSKAEVSEMKAEKIEEKQSEAVTRKVDKKETEAKELKAEISEITLEKVEEKLIDSSAKTIEQKKIEEMKLKAEVSEVEVQKIKEEQLSSKSQKVEPTNVEAMKSKGEVSEVEAEVIEEKQSEAVRKKVDTKETEAEKLRAEVTEITQKEIEGKLCDYSVKTAERERTEGMKLTTDISEELEDEIRATKSKEIIEDALEDNIPKKAATTTGRKVEKLDKGSLDANSKISEHKEMDVKEIQPYVKKDETIEIESETKAAKRLKEIGEGVPEKKEKVKENEYKENKEMRNAKRTPRVDVKLTNRNSSLGSDIKLTCSILGNDLQIQWFKENKRLENNSKYKISFMDGLSCLEIKSADYNDAAVYRCAANNRNGEVETSCLVTVYDVPTNKFGTPPIFTRNIREARTIENALVLGDKAFTLTNESVFSSIRETGHKVRLTCAVGGPELSVKWFKDGRQLERDATHRIINNNNILILEVINTTILDSGEYSCVIANMNDEVTSSCFVTIYEVFKDEPAPPTFKLIKEYYHLRDDELTIEMHIHGVPRPVVTWWKSSFEIKPNFKFTMLEEAHGVYKLLIYKPNNRDSGTYICKAINSCGEAQMRHTIEVAKNLNYHVHGIFHARGRLQQDKEQSAKKAMEEAMKSKEASDKKRVVSEVGPRVPRGSPEPLVSPKQKLKFATQLRDRMALEGSTVRFVCNVIGPNPASRWMKDDNFVKYGENVKNFSEEGKPMLELRNVTTESSGVYKCVAKNDHSEIETSCYFKVYAAQTEGDESEPIFALPLRDVYHSSQNDLVLDTKVRGNPRPSITWLKDRVPVVLDDRIVQIEHLDGICELIINKPTPSDNGTYFCVAQNKLGSQEAQHSVVVDVVQTSRRSSTQSAAMSDSSDSKSKGEQSSKAPKGKKKEDEGGEAAGYERRSRLPEVNPKQQLYFNAIVSNRYVTEGSKVKLQAVVMGPNPAMKWMKDDQNLTYGPRIRNMSRDCLAVLEFLKAMPEDSGTYTLVAQNEYCKISTSAKLLVYSTNVSAESEPVFTRPLRDTYHLNTNELILETGVRGQPAPKVQWFKDSVEVEKSERLHISNHTDGSCELVIDYPSTKDSGKYTVKAESSAGKAEITHLVTFAGKDHHIADNIHGVFHADKNLLKAKLAELEVPKDQKHPEVSESEGEEGKGKGKGKAKARGKKDEEEEVAAVAADTSTTETPKKREKVIGIHFPTTVKDRVVAEGSKVKISCFLAAKEPQVKWFKNEEPIQNSPKIRGRHVEGLCTLEITSATEEDSGEYKCWARDETGEASTFCRLKVYADPGSADVPPTFTRNIKETYHPKLHELQLECHVRGSPTAIITWVKDGVKIEQSDKYQHIDHNDGTCELVVTDPAQADSGKYVCQAENRAGKAEIAYKVTVEPKRIRAPSPPMKESKVSRKSIAEETTDDEEKEKKKAKKKKDDEEEGGGRRREVPPPPDMKKRVYLRNFLSNRTVKEGSNVKWVVNIDGAEPTARWFHGETPIVFGPKSKMNLQDGIAWLQLVKVTEEDSGEYLVKVKGPENEVVSTCNLFVYSTGKEEIVAPVFTVGIKDVFDSVQHLLIIESKVTGKPKPKVYWQRDSTLLLEDSNKYKYVELDDGVQQLVIINPTDSDTGLYTCYAESESGQMKISKFIDLSDYRLKEKTLRNTKIEKLQESTTEKIQANIDDIQEMKAQAKDAQFKLRLETPMKSMTIAAGCKAQLICYISGFIEDVYWLRDDERIFKDARHKIYNINNSLSLEIYEARTDDSGKYKCVVRNSRNTIESQCQLDVYDSISGILPAGFSQPITVNYDGQRGELLLACHVHGRPKITWLRDDHNISNNRYRIIEEAGGITKLIIRNPIHTDCDTYSLNDNELVLDCRVRGKPRPDVQWMKGTDYIVPGEKYTQVNEDDGYTKIIVHNPTEKDSGLYACVARNEAGENKLTHHVEFVGRERFSFEKTHGFFHRDPNKPHLVCPLGDQTVHKGGTIAISAEFMQTQSPIDVQWLLNRQSIAGHANIKTFHDHGVYTLAITDATPECEGTYTCRAQNAFGRIESHAHVDISQGATKEERPPLFLSRPENEMKIAVGDPFSISFRIAGDPKPKLSFLKGTKDITKSDRVSKEASDDYTRFTVQKSQISDSGTYFVVARNNNGTDRLFVTIEVKTPKKKE